MLKRCLLLLLVVLLLCGCGGKSTPTIPSAQQAETALAEMPLPQSEQTLLAELPPLETTLSNEKRHYSHLTMTPYRLRSTQISPARRPPPQSHPPARCHRILSPPRAAASARIDPQVILRDRSLSRSVSGRCEQAPVPLVEEVAPPNEVIIESRSTPVPSAGLGQLIPPGLVCSDRPHLLGLGLYMNTTSQPTGQEINCRIEHCRLCNQGLVWLS